MTNQPIR